MGLTKEESRRREALRKQRRVKTVKAAIIASSVLMIPVVAYLVGQG